MRSNYQFGRAELVEPYALRRTVDGRLLLLTIQAASGADRGYVVADLQGVEITTQPFEPRYRIELTGLSVR